jgi:hypothetical protein
MRERSSEESSFYLSPRVRRTPSTRPAILSQVGLEVEELVAGSHLESDPGGGVGVADQDPVAEHSVSQVSRRTIEDDEVDTTAEEFPEGVGKVSAQTLSVSLSLGILTATL